MTELWGATSPAPLRSGAVGLSSLEDGSKDSPLSITAQREFLFTLQDVARLRSRSAALWALSWAIGYGALVALLLLTLGSPGGSANAAVAYLGLFPFAALAALVSLAYGFFSTRHWAEQFHRIGSVDALNEAAWAPGVREGKRYWNYSRRCLQFSWGMIALALVGGFGALFWLLLVSAEGTGGAYSDALLAVVGLYLGVLFAFVVFRILHHYWFAKSVSWVAGALSPPLSSAAWPSHGLWWTVGAVTLEINPAVVAYSVYLPIALLSSGGNDAVLLFLAVIAGGVGGLLGSVLLAYRYRELALECRRRLGGLPSEDGGPGIPPEWLS